MIVTTGTLCHDCGSRMVFDVMFRMVFCTSNVCDSFQNLDDDDDEIDGLDWNDSLGG